MKAKKLLRFLGAIIVLGLGLAIPAGLAPTAASAAAIYWNGTAGNSGDWNTLGNWSTASNATTPNPVAVPGSADVATFSISGLNTAETVNLNAAQAVAGLSFLGDNSGTTLLEGGGAAGQNLTSGTSGITVASGAGAVTIGSSTANQGVAVLLSGSQNWANNSANLLTVVNNISNAGNTTPYVVTFNGSGAGGTLLDGPISDGGSTGTTGLTVNTSGGGVTTLAGANTFSGTTTLTAGILQLANTAALGSSALKLNGGTLQLRSDNSGTFADASTTIGGSVTFDVNQADINGTGGTLSLGAVSLTNGKTIGVTGSNGYTLGLGAITVNAGGNGTTTINPTTANITTAGINFTTGNGAVTKTGTGTWTLNGSLNLNSYPGSLTVSAGILQMGYANSWAATGGGTNLVVNGGAFDLAGYSQTTAKFNGSGGTITNSSTTPCTLTVNQLNNENGSVYAGLITDNGGTGTLGVSLGVGVSGPTGPTTLTLSGSNNTYTGVTNIQGNTSYNYNTSILTVSTLANGLIPSSIGASSNLATNLVLDYGGVLKYAGSTTSTDRLFSVGKDFGGMIDASGTGPVNFANAGTIGFNNASGARYLALVGTNTGYNNMAATITNSGGATSVTKGGGGTWVLGNLANSYTGVTTVGGGVLNVPSLAAGGSNSSIGASTSAASNLVLAGGTLQYTGATAQTTNRLFTIAATGGAIDASGAGTLSFTNTGANVSSDPASRTYYDTQSNSTVINFLMSNTLATDLLPGMTVSSGGTISSVNSPYQITVSASPGYINPGTMSFGYNAAVTGARALTLTGSNSGGNTIAGSLANSPSATLALTKMGVGQWVLSGSNTYTGPTTVNGGQLNVLGSLAAGSAVTVNGGGMLAGSGIINGPVTVAGGSSSAAQGGINLVDGTIDTLSLNSTLALGGSAAGNPSQLYFEYGSGGFDKVAVGGPLALNAGGGAINLTSLGTPSLGTYSLLTFPSEAQTGAFTFAANGLTTMNVGNQGFTLNNTGTAETLTVSSASATPASYSLGLTAATTHAHAGETVGLTAAITNSGGGTYSDSIDYSGLGATAASGVFGGASGPGNVVYGGSASNTGLTYSNSAGGSYTLTAAVASALNHTSGTAATLTSAQSVTVTFYSGHGIWSGNSSSNWNDYGNWDSVGGVPGLDANYLTGDTATFGTTTAGPVTVNLNGVNPSITTLTFSSATSSYTLAQGSSGTLTLNGSGAAINVAGSHAISAPVALGSNTTISTNNGGDSLSVSGAISGSGNSLTLSGPGLVTVSGAVSGNGTSLTVAGPGLVTLSGSNTYSGATAVSGGTLALGTLSGTAVGSLPGGSVLTLGSGGSSGVFQLGDASNPVNQTLAGLTTSGNGAANAVVGGNIAVSTLTLSGSASSIYSGLLGGTGANQNNLSLTVNMSGSGGLTLLGANTYIGTTTLTAGALQLADTAAIGSSALTLNGGTLQLRGDASGTFATAGTTIGGNTTIDVNQAVSGSGGTLSLGAVNVTNNYTVNVTGGNGYTLGLGAITDTTVNNGTMTINPTTGNLVTGGVIYTSANGNVNKTGAGTWTLGGAVNLNSYPANLTVSAGILQMGYANSWAGWGGGTNLVVNGGTFDLAGYSQATAKFNGSGGTMTNSSTTPCTLTINAVNNQFGNAYAGAITDNGGSGTLGLTINPANNINETVNAITLALTGTASTYTGATTIVGGSPGNSTCNSVSEVIASSLANGGSPSSIGASSNAAANLVLDFGGALQYVGPATSTDRLFSIGNNYGGMIDSSGAGPVSFTNTGTIGFNGVSGPRYLALVGSNTGNNSLAATVADNGGATSVTKAGPGTWLLTSAANSYSGATVVGGGILNVPALADIGVASPVGAGASTSNATNAASLVLSGGTLQYTGSTAQSTDRLFTIAASGGAIDASGSGTLTFSNTGAIVSSDPASKSTFNTGGNTEIFVQSNLLATDLVAGMTVTGGGLPAGTTITSVNGPTSITLSNTPANWGNKTFTFSTANRTLTLTGSNAGPNTIAGSLANSASGGQLSVVKTGAGTWFLSGANTYSGGTTLNAGTLVADDGNNNSPTFSAFGTGPLTLNGGTLAAGPAGGSVAGAVSPGSGTQTIAPGAGLVSGYGTLNLNGGLTSSASTTLAFNFDLSTTAGTDSLGGNIYGGDLINLNGSALNVSGGNIIFAAGSTPTLVGDYRLFAGYYSPNVPPLSLPAAPGADTYALSPSVDNGYLDLVVTTSSESWTSSGSGSWATAGNWFPATVPTSGSVTFAGSNTPITVTLDANQTAGSLVFGDKVTPSSYTISVGTLQSATLTLGDSTGASISVLSGTHTISAPLILAGSADIAPAPGTQLAISGDIGETGGSQSLTLSGAGVLILGGSNNYSGGTNVAAGTLYLTNSLALPNESNLTIGAGGTFIFDPNGPPGYNAKTAALPAGAVEAVPEPGTLALLLVALWGAAIYRRFRRPKSGFSWKPCP